jgi:hypothetical protein
VQKKTYKFCDHHELVNEIAEKSAHRMSEEEEKIQSND